MAAYDRLYCIVEQVDFDIGANKAVSVAQRLCWYSVRLRIEGLLVRDSLWRNHSVVSLRNTLYPMLSTGSILEDRKSSQHD